MKGQLVRAVERDEALDGDEAALALREPRTLPHVAEQNVISECGECRGDVPKCLRRGDALYPA
jgi:hypothetical protein